VRKLAHKIDKRIGVVNNWFRIRNAFPPFD
jgi:hypothetical protein